MSLLQWNVDHSITWINVFAVLFLLADHPGGASDGSGAGLSLQGRPGADYQNYHEKWTAEELQRGEGRSDDQSYRRHTNWCKQGLVLVFVMRNGCLSLYRPGILGCTSIWSSILMYSVPSTALYSYSKLRPDNWSLFFSWNAVVQLGLRIGDLRNTTGTRLWIWASMLDANLHLELSSDDTAFLLRAARMIWAISSARMRENKWALRLLGGVTSIRG